MRSPLSQQSSANCGFTALVSIYLLISKTLGELLKAAVLLVSPVPLTVS